MEETRADAILHQISQFPFVTMADRFKRPILLVYNEFGTECPSKFNWNIPWKEPTTTGEVKAAIERDMPIIKQDFNVDMFYSVTGGSRF